MLHKRKKIWIDSFQTHLIARVFLYCVLFQAAIWAVVLTYQTFDSMLGAVLGEGTATCFYSIGLVGTLTVTAIAMYDGLKLSHRIVGPLYRFRKTIQAISAGEELDLIRLREGDYLQDLRDDFNLMLRALEQHGAVRLKDERVRIAPPSSARIESTASAVN